MEGDSKVGVGGCSRYYVNRSVARSSRRAPTLPPLLTRSPSARAIILSSERERGTDVVGSQCFACVKSLHWLSVSQLSTPLGRSRSLSPQRAVHKNGRTLANLKSITSFVYYFTSSIISHSFQQLFSVIIIVRSCLDN